MVAIFPASTAGGGTCMAFPDVCNVPVLGVPVPIPFPNIAMVSQAKKTKSKVKIDKKKTVVKDSEISRSMGDEAGVQKGIISGMNMDKVTFKSGSGKVKAEGKDVCHLTSMTAHNGGQSANMPAGLQIAPSQTKVKVAP